MISFAAASRTGPRPRNEDVVVLPGLVSTGEIPTIVEMTMAAGPPLVFAVVDGMGGQVGGQQASRMVADGLALATPREPLAGSIEAVLGAANTRLYELMAADSALTGMGATVAGVVVGPETVLVFNVGDARVYQHGGGYSVLLSIDDRVSPDSGVVTQSIGGAERPTAIAPHISEVPIADGMRLLICSDGVTDPLSFAALQEALQAPTASAAVEALLTAVATAGARDNTSLIVIDVTPERGDQRAASH